VPLQGAADAPPAIRDPRSSQACVPPERVDPDRARIALRSAIRSEDAHQARPEDRRRATDRLYAGRFVADRLVDPWTFTRLTGLLEARGYIRPGSPVAKWCKFASFHADGETGELGEMHRAAFLYAEWHDLAEARWYEHRKAAQRLGLVRQLRAAAPDQKPRWRISFPAALLEPGAILSPSSLPDDLADHLGYYADEFVFDYDADEFEDEFLAPRTAAAEVEVRTEHGVTRTPPAVDPAAAAHQQLLTVGEWIGESYVVASAIRAERALFGELGIGESFDVAAAEARVRARLEYPEHGFEQDSLGYVDAAEEALFAARHEDPEPAAKLQLTGYQEELNLENPETLPSSPEGISSIWFVTVSKYWAAKADEEKQKAAATQQGVGPVERKRAGQLLRRHVWWEWAVWAEKYLGRSAPPISAGQWEDLTTAVAYALRRTSPGTVIATCTESLGSARDLIPTVGYRLWRINKTMPEYREWQAYRRGQTAAAAPSWHLPPGPSVIGPASARAEVRRAQGGRAEIGRQVEIDQRPGAAAPSRKAERARESVVSAGLERRIRKSAADAATAPSQLTAAEHAVFQERARTRESRSTQTRTAENIASLHDRAAAILARVGAEQGSRK